MTVENVAASTTDNTNVEAKTTDVPLLAAENEVKTEPAKTEGTDQKDETKVEVAPEKYEDFKMPETVEKLADVDAEFKELAKELKLPQKEAQRLVDLQNKVEAKRAEQLANKWNELNDNWVKEAKEDKEIGGKDFEANLGLAKKALAKFGTPELNDVLKLTGLGNNKEAIRLLVKVGKTIKEDDVMSSGGNSAGSVDPAKTLFPDMA